MRAQTTRIAFKVHTFRCTRRYKCTCGKTYQRSSKSEWTENPFNKLFMAGQITELNDKCAQEARNLLKTKPCPTCGTENEPYA